MIKKRDLGFTFRNESIVSIIINTIGAFMTYFYLNVIDPAPTAENSISSLDTSSSLIFIAILVIFFSVGISWGNTYKKGFKEWYELIESGEKSPADVPQKVKRDLLNFPLYAAGIAGLMWFSSSIAATVITRSIRVFIGLFLCGGATAVALLYFADSLLWQPIIPAFFPDGKISKAQAFHLPLFWKLLVVFLFTGFFLPVLLVGLTWQRVEMLLTVPNPEMVLDNLRLLQIFILGASIISGIGLAIFTIRGISNPLYGLRKAMERVQNDDLDAKVVVSTNDEVGYLGECFNQMTAELRQKEILFNANVQLRGQLAKIKELETALREQAIRDPLTGLFNRRYMNEALENEFHRAIRQNSELCIVMLDLDGFKEINDKYGHVEGGDQSLRALAQILETHCRKEDTICRYAGDEFVVILYGTSAKIAFARALEWKKWISEIKIKTREKPLSITFSAGIAEFSPRQKNAEEILKCADQALYQAKEAGRNRIIVYNDQG